MKYNSASLAIVFAVSFGFAGVIHAADDGGGQGGMQPGSSKGSLGNQESSDPGSMSKKKAGETSQKQKLDKQQGDTEAPPTTTGKQGDAGVTGDRFGESGSGQGSGGGSGTQSGSGVGSR